MTGRDFWPILGFAAIVALAPLLVASNVVLNFLVFTLIIALAAQGWNLLGGYGGQYSFGHAAFFGTGAYVTAILQVRFRMNAYPAFAAGVALAALVGLAIGSMAFRSGLRGSYFALVTLAFAEVFRVLANAAEVTGGAAGILIRLQADPANFQFAERGTFLWVAGALVTLALLATLALERSRLGAQLVAVRENEAAAQALEDTVLAVKLRTIALSAGMTGAAGGLYAQYFLYLDATIAYGTWISVQRAARKKFIVSRIGDVALVGAVILLAISFGTGDIATILAAAREGEGLPLTVTAAALLAVAALLKSAQFPTHGWLTEVMETPTPVSALLHAGVVNAGGFLLIRFADVMLQAPVVLAVLVMVGGFTALFGSLVMLTQSAVKTSLAWSTVAQMGFMILQCGLALFPIALLHIVAHSLYKAHAFLASGSAIETVASIKRPGPVAIPNAKAVGRAFLLALAIYAVIGLLFGFADKPPQALALGAILIFGVAYLIAQGLADAAPRALTWRTSLYSISAATAYFALQRISDKLMLGTLPATPQPGPLEWTLMLLAVVTFGVVAVAQSLFPLWAHHPATAGLRVHLANGLYVNALFDRLLGGWTLPRTTSATPASVKE